MTSKTVWLSIAALVLTVGTASAQQQKPQEMQQPIGSDKYDEQLARYLDSARKQATDMPARGANDWMNGLMGDLRAKQVNDLVTIRVVESITASGSADSNLSKASSGSASLPKFFGGESKLPSIIDPTNLASAKSSTGFKGAGTTTRAGELSAIVTGRVAEVLRMAICLSRACARSRSTAIVRSWF